MSKRRNSQPAVLRRGDRARCRAGRGNGLLDRAAAAERNHASAAGQSRRNRRPANRRLPIMPFVWIAFFAGLLAFGWSFLTWVIIATWIFIIWWFATRQGERGANP